MHGHLIDSARWVLFAILIVVLITGTAVACAADSSFPNVEESSLGPTPTFAPEFRPTQITEDCASTLCESTPVPTVVQGTDDCEFGRGASCPGVDLSGLDLGAIMHDYKTEGRDGFDMRGGDLTDAILIGTNLEAARIEGTILHQANLKGANLRSSFGYQADFTGANLTGVMFMYADIEEAIFDGANLTNANLGNAILVNASLRDADLTGTDLTGADLRGADLEGAILDGTIFCRTTMPDESMNDTNCLD